jgi:hypothetical protein
MRNITVKISDNTYRDARVWAARQDTSISEVVQYLLQTLPTNARAARAFPLANPRTANTRAASSANQSETN